MTFEAHVAERMAAGAAEYGDASYRRPLADLLAEIAEEAADIGAWARIAGHVLDQRRDLEPYEREAVGDALQSATILAAGAHRRLSGALAIVEGADREVAA
jgi:hypothetical protein